MSETSPVITVKQEVETVLRLTLEAYAVQTEAADDLVKGNAEFHEAVLAVLNDIIEAYVAPEPVLEDPTIRVGDTVRTQGHPFYPDGTEFAVTRVTPGNFTPSSGRDRGTRKFFVSGDRGGYGVWDIFIEKVTA